MPRIDTDDPPFCFEMQPALIEDAVLRAISAHPQEQEFRKQRDRIYSENDDDKREQSFQRLHERWFEILGLGKPLHQVFEQWPLLKVSTRRCLLMKAQSRGEAGAELYIDPAAQGTTERDNRTVIIQLTAEMLCSPQSLLRFLRHEMLHIVDMLDPSFGYEPTLPRSGLGPAYDHLLQQRYAVLWDITIDGRLHKNGWLPESVRDRHFAMFKRTFQGRDADWERVFSHFFDMEGHTHQELMSFAREPDERLGGATPRMSGAGRCSLCHFPSYQLIDSARYPTEMMIAIQKDYPTWRPTDPICQQCLDLYAARRTRAGHRGALRNELC